MTSSWFELKLWVIQGFIKQHVCLLSTATCAVLPCLRVWHALGSFYFLKLNALMTQYEGRFLFSVSLARLLHLSVSLALSLQLSVSLSVSLTCSVSASVCLSLSHSSTLYLCVCVSLSELSLSLTCSVSASVCLSFFLCLSPLPPRSLPIDCIGSQQGRITHSRFFYTGFKAHATKSSKKLNQSPGHNRQQHNYDNHLQSISSQKQSILCFKLIKWTHLHLDYNWLNGQCWNLRTIICTTLTHGGKKMMKSQSHLIVTIHIIQ